MPQARATNPGVLIIVDVQKGFITEQSKHVIRPIQELQHRFKHVVVAKFSNPDHSPFRSILNYHKLAPHSKESELTFMPREDAFLIDRPLYTCVTRALKSHLKEIDKNEVFLCGVATEACVLKTALDLFESNIRTWLIADLCASDQGDEYHLPAISLLKKLIGKNHVIESVDLI